MFASIAQTTEESWEYEVSVQSDHISIINRTFRTTFIKNYLFFSLRKLILLQF